MIGGHALTGDLRHGLGLFFTGSYSRLQNDFAASPVTSVAGSPNQWFGALGLGYTF
jgi:outer membrane scaffolding protein for murein synthesis (MipA/OmpV family)